MSDLRITSIEELKEYSKGQIVELPPFAEGQPFVARLARPSILELVKSGSIPNELLTTANKLFVGSSMDVRSNTMLTDVFQVLDALCEATFVEPTYQQIKNAGIKLTDDQIMFIFSYSQKGVEALKPFRQQSENSGSVGNVSAV